MTERELGARSSERGQMTQVMRAAVRPAKSPGKSLRIAAVHRGAVTSEQIVERGKSVTIGATERATFVIAERDLPPKYALFDHAEGRLRLNLLPWMSARVATRTGLDDFAAQPSGASDKPVVRHIALGDDARGKVTIGEATFLFQLVEPRPPKTKVPLALSFQKGLTSEIDWMTAIIAAVSFLLHFGVVGSLYGDWVDPAVDDQVDVGALVEIVRSLPAPPATERDDRPVDATATATTAAPATTSGGATAAKGAGKSIGGGAPGAGKGSAKSMGDARAAELSGQLQAANLEMIGALSSHGASTDNVLAHGGDLSTGLLNDVAKEGVGAGRGAVAGLNMEGSGSGVVRPGGGNGRSLGTIGDTHGGAPASAGSAAPVARPHAQAQIGGAVPSGGDVLDAGSVVGGMAPGFRACYNRGITNEDPSMRGTIRLTLKIAPNGDVSSVTPTSGGSLSSTVVACVAARASSAHFHLGGAGGGATLVVPVTFVQ